MKKKIMYFLAGFLLFFLLVLIIKKISLNSSINNTNKYKDNINYSTNIQLTIIDKNSSSKINYDIFRNLNVRKIIISNYVNDKLKNEISRYMVNKNGKTITYTFNGKSYDKIQNKKEDFIVNYNLLKKGKIKSFKKNEYVIKMKSYNAYNLIYDKKIMTNKDLKSKTDVKIKIDNKTNFIKEISYNIKEKNLDYKVTIKNTDINNQKEIKLPF